MALAFSQLLFCVFSEWFYFFGLLFKRIYVILTIFTIFGKKGPRPKWNMYNHESVKNKKYLSVSSYEIVSACSASTVYTSLCRGIKYLLEVMYFILVYCNVVGFWIIGNLCLGSSKTLTYV